jgi:hypothetical protein
MDSMDEERRKQRASWPVRKTTLAEQDDYDDLAGTTPEERVGMMWQLTLDAWAFTGQPLAESRLQRHIVRFHRRKG